MRRKLKTKSGISPLLKDLKDPDSLKFDDVDKANILQDQFSSVFTVEDDSRIPSIPEKTDQKVNFLIITEAMVFEEICALNPNKSCGPDDVSPLMLVSTLLNTWQAYFLC